jgi:hypothetical protein
VDSESIPHFVEHQTARLDALRYCYLVKKI